MSNEKSWSVGELARASGVTVRTLHHYDAIGLLRADRRAGSGYRFYSDAHVRRLYQILALRQLGFGLEDIEGWLSAAGSSTLATVEQHLERLREAEKEARELRQGVERLAEQIRANGDVPTGDFLETMEMMTMFEKYYTAEQLEQLGKRREAVGEERIKEVEAEWPRLMSEVRAEMEKGTDPSDPRVQELARRWQGLVAEFTGGDPGIGRSLGKMYQSEERVAGMDVGPMREMGEYIGRASAAAQDED